MDNKIIRSICYFTKEINHNTLKKIEEIKNSAESNGYLIQTKRICTGNNSIRELDNLNMDDSFFLSTGTLSREAATKQLDDFLNSGNVSFNIDITNSVTKNDVDILYKIIEQNPKKTFNFSFTVNNASSTPFFPAADYSLEGFSIGLQSTNLAFNCKTIEEWFREKRNVWKDLYDLFGRRNDFIGIDSSVAPLFDREGSFVNFIKKTNGTFEKAVTTDIFIKISEYIKNENPKPVGLCGLMFPCLEDFELADEYERGNFSIERNLFLSLHSGLGIDTYPIGIDEPGSRILEVLELLRGLSKKHAKPLSARFVSDGISGIGEISQFSNKYLKDVKIRKL
ncbi:MAG: DUF711 family protein [Acidobacteriota bacterium]